MSNTVGHCLLAFGVTLGVIVASYALTKLGHRSVAWMREDFGEMAQRTDTHVRDRLIQTPSAPLTPQIDPERYCQKLCFCGLSIPSDFSPMQPVL